MRRITYRKRPFGSGLIERRSGRSLLCKGCRRMVGQKVPCFACRSVSEVAYNPHVASARSQPTLGVVNGLAGGRTHGPPVNPLTRGRPHVPERGVGSFFRSAGPVATAIVSLEASGKPSLRWIAAKIISRASKHCGNPFEAIV